MESILNSIKKPLGLQLEDDAFDADLIMHINSVFFTLNQLGVGPVDGFNITDASQNWSSFLGDNKKLEAVKSYLYLKVKMLFDPPTSSFVMDAMNRQAEQFEWRLNVEVEDPPPNIVPERYSDEYTY